MEIIHYDIFLLIISLNNLLDYKFSIFVSIYFSSLESFN